MGGTDNSFEDRLAAARARQGMNTPADAAGAKAPAGGGFAGVALRSGVEFASAVAVAVGIGFFLDRWLGTRPAFTIGFALLGWVAGLLNVRRAIVGMTTPPDRGTKG